MSKQVLTTEQTQAQHLALEQQRLLGTMLEKNDAEMTEYIENKVNENEALEIKQDDNNDDAQQNNSNDSSNGQEAAADSGDDEAAAWYRFFAKNNGPDDEWIEPTAVSEKTLHEFLTDQIGELNLDNTQLLIADYIVYSIDEKGYLTRTAAEIADDVTFKENVMVDEPQVQQVLEAIQTLDPPGIAARDPQECLLLQLRCKPQTEDIALAITMVEQHLQELPQRRFDLLSRRMGVDKERLEKVFDREIRRGLNPCPGYAFESRNGNSQQVTPDFDVEIDDETQRITVTLRNKIPALQISESFEFQNECYKSKLPLSVNEQREKKRIVDAYQSASMFIKVLKQRQETLFRTMSAIVECQHEYFLSGDERDLNPLGQQKIADMIGKDITAVSRAINNKYVQTPWGIKSLKSFFSEDINGESRHRVFAAIRELIDNEDKTHPLSDEALCRRLREMGFTLERRTVTKYRRDTLGIPSSTERRRMA